MSSIPKDINPWLRDYLLQLESEGYDFSSKSAQRTIKSLNYNLINLRSSSYWPERGSE